MINSLIIKSDILSVPPQLKVNPQSTAIIVLIYKNQTKLHLRLY